MLLDRKPFYAEGGGQVTDTGLLSKGEFRANVVNVSKHHNVYVHKIEVLSGELQTGDTVMAQVDAAKRHGAARNHTSTHLLHKALKKIVGEHVEQAGSYVTADSLRFDFTHFEAVSKEMLADIEKSCKARNRIFPFQARELPIERLKRPAPLRSGEKYGRCSPMVSTRLAASSAEVPM